jgi:hypothetical protein
VSPPIPTPNPGSAKWFDGFVEHIMRVGPALYESWAFMAHNQDVGNGTMEYDSDDERAFYDGVFAAIRRRETITDATSGEPRWRRCEYGTALPRDHMRRRPHSRTRQSHRTRPGHRRSGATSKTASSDPGDPDPEGEPPGRRGQLRHISEILACELCRLEDVELNVSVAAGELWTCLACHVEATS